MNGRLARVSFAVSSFVVVMAAAVLVAGGDDRVATNKPGVAVRGVAVLPGGSAVSVTPTAADEPLDFNRDIRPILSSTCFECHGPDARVREKTGGYRLDDGEGAFKPSAKTGKRPIVPGDPEASELIGRIFSDDPEKVMPPPEARHQLDAAQKQKLREWIEQGAEYQKHWAFVTPKRPVVPKVGNSDWVRNDVDPFVLARLKEAGLPPSRQADRRALIRRVTLDLTGLPPTIEEVEAFVNDKSPNAYEKVVDRLLASPHYGEHMARFWLDAVRYADTHGLHFDNYREIWPYRDWVIRAFNSNLPFDKFIVWQIAGDMLENPTQDQMIASGYNRCNVTTNEGGSILEEVYVRNVIDRVSTTGTVFLGLSFGCAQCHDHKFDPVSQEEFYGAFAFFNNIEMTPMDGNRKDHAPVMKVISPEDQAEADRLAAEVESVNKKLAAANQQWDAAQAAWENKVRSDKEQVNQPALGPWKMIGPFKAGNAFDKNFGPEGQAKLAANYARKQWVERKDFADGAVHTLGQVPSSAIYLARTIAAPEDMPLVVSLGSDDGIKVFLNGKQLLAKNVGRAAMPDQEKVTLPLKKGDNQLLLKISNGGGPTAFYFKSTGSGMPLDIRSFIVAGAKRDAKQSAAVRDYFRKSIYEPTMSLIAARDQSEAKRKSLTDNAPVTLVSKERAEEKPSYFLIRGLYDNKRPIPGKTDADGKPIPEVIPRHVPAALHPLPEGAPLNRLGFAQWLVDQANPLTARVMVNRFWQQYFGTGIVKTSEDFGNQGDRPTHPQLLDYLTVEFVESGWDVKRLQKMIVMSATYQQDSKVTDDALAKDPENRLLGRGPRFRLDAEMIRDQTLAVSGLLNDEVYGPPVKPPQPKGLWDAVGYAASNTRFFRQDVGDKIYRRSVYVFYKRTSPPPYLTICDAPSREAATVRRERTSTPLEALLLMNEQLNVESARYLAETTIKALPDGSPSDRVAFIYERAMLKPIDSHQRQTLTAAYSDFRNMYRDAPEEAKTLIAIGESQPDAAIDPVELAAWTMVCNVVLNLDEVVNKG